MYPTPPPPRDEAPDDDDYGPQRPQPPADPSVVLSPEERVADLERRLRKLERKISASSLHSEFLMHRAMTVWGHYMLFHLIIVAPFVILLLCAGLLVPNR